MSGRRSTLPAPADGPVGTVDHEGSLSKGLAILHAFHAGDTYLGNKELAARAGLTPSTVSRLAGRLMALGYLRYSESRGQYALGTAVLRLAYPMLAGLSIRQIARPVMKELADEVEGQCSLGMCSGTEMVFIETSRNARHRYTLPEAGATIAILLSAMGRAYAAALAPAERERLSRWLRQQQPEAWAEHGEKIAQGATDFLRLGFTRSLGDARPELHACAVPLRTRIDGTIVVMNCSVPAHKLKPQQLERAVGPRVVAAARQIDSGMGAASNG